MVYDKAESGCWQRKFACFSCDGCKLGKWRTATSDDLMKGNLFSQHTFNSLEVVKIIIVGNGSILNSKNASTLRQVTFGTI